MSRFELMIRARPSDDMESRHEKLMSCFSSLKNGWSFVTGSEIPKVTDPGTLPMRQIKLSKCFRTGVKGLVSYQNRRYFADEGKYDDYIKLDFDSAKCDYAVLVNDCFEKLTEAFDAYRGHIGIDHFILADFPRSVQVESKRAGVYRIHPVCFFDKELCERAFHLRPEEIAGRVNGSVESARLVGSGVLIIASSAVVSIDEATAIDQSLKQLLL